MHVESFVVCMVGKMAQDELSHRPRILMSNSSMPHSAAVVAAPILKLWPAYIRGAVVAENGQSCSHLIAIKICFVKKRPSLILNRGPGSIPRSAK